VRPATNQFLTGDAAQQAQVWGRMVPGVCVCVSVCVCVCVCMCTCTCMCECMRIIKLGQLLLVHVCVSVCRWIVKLGQLLHVHVCQLLCPLGHPQAILNQASAAGQHAVAGPIADSVEWLNYASSTPCPALLRPLPTRRLS